VEVEAVLVPGIGPGPDDRPGQPASHGRPDGARETIELDASQPAAIAGLIERAAG
jgi:hypothetical protein